MPSPLLSETCLYICICHRPAICALDRRALTTACFLACSHLSMLNMLMRSCATCLPPTLTCAGQRLPLIAKHAAAMYNLWWSFPDGFILVHYTKQSYLGTNCKHCLMQLSSSAAQTYGRFPWSPCNYTATRWSSFQSCHPAQACDTCPWQMCA